MMTSALVVITTVVIATTRAQQPQRPQHFKIGFLAPWNATFDDYSALTSASAISIAIERIHADPTLNKSVRFRFVSHYLHHDADDRSRRFYFNKQFSARLNSELFRRAYGFTLVPL